MSPGLKQSESSSANGISTRAIRPFRPNDGPLSRAKVLAVRPYKDNMVTVKSLVDGYRGAHMRFQQAALEHDPHPAFHALFETLNWAVALDDRIGAHWVPEGEPLGFGWRDRFAGAKPLSGVRWARNRVHHDWSDALVLSEEGMQFPMRFPTTFFEWVWRNVEALPPAGKPDPEGEKVYAELLAGRAARIALVSLEEVFEKLLPILEPPTWRA